jgi:hypothetical protein
MVSEGAHRDEVDEFRDLAPQILERRVDESFELADEGIRTGKLIGDTSEVVCEVEMNVLCALAQEVSSVGEAVTIQVRTHAVQVDRDRFNIDERDLVQYFNDLWLIVS